MAEPAVSERVIDAPVDAVASVLADPRAYDGIVVGSRRVRWFDPRWPEGGTALHHTVGFGPLTIRDHTDVRRDALPDELELAAGLRPAGVMRVVFRLRAEGSGTRVTMEEGPLSGPVTWMWASPARAAMRRRNDVALSRLDDLARARAAVRDLDADPRQDRPPAGAAEARARAGP